jgi:hypothetical protein
MTYSVGGLIQSTDINGFVSTNSPNFNNIWSTGSNDTGYGQPALSTIVLGDRVAQNPWNELITNINKSANHQGTIIVPYTAPVVTDKISFLSSLNTNIGLINSNRLNASIQGSTTTSVSTCVDTWDNKLTVTFTIDFSNNNAARYFFNAGGQLGISCSHPAGVGSTLNTILNNLCNNVGTVWLSSPSSGQVSLSSTLYSGVTKIGGGNPSGTTVNTNYGFYSYTSTPTVVFTQLGDRNYYGTSLEIQILVQSNAAGLITITVAYSDVPPLTAVNISSGTVTTLTVRNPSSAQLSNTWGTPVLNNSYVI